MLRCPRWSDATDRRCGTAIELAMRHDGTGAHLDLSVEAPGEPALSAAVSTDEAVCLSRTEPPGEPAPL